MALPQQDTPCLMLTDPLGLETQHRNLLGVFFIVIGLMGTLLNIVPFYIVCRTRDRQRNPSSKLTFFISMSDILRSSTGHIIFGLDLILDFCQHRLRLDHTHLAPLTGNSVECWELRLMVLPLIVFSLSSAYLNCLVILDRFLRIMFIQNYTAFLTPRKFTAAMMLYVALVLSQMALVLAGDVYLDGFKMGGMLLTLPVNLGLFILCIALHLKSIRMLHVHQQTICLTLGSQKILKLATVYLVTFAVFYAPLLTVNVLVVFKEQLEFSRQMIARMIVLTLGVTAFSSPVNAITFSVNNIKARNTIRKQYRRFRQTKIWNSNRIETSPSAG